RFIRLLIEINAAGLCGTASRLLHSRISGGLCLCSRFSPCATSRFSPCATSRFSGGLCLCSRFSPCATSRFSGGGSSCLRRTTATRRSGSSCSCGRSRRRTCTASRSVSRCCGGGSCLRRTTATRRSCSRCGGFRLSLRRTTATLRSFSRCGGFRLSLRRTTATLRSFSRCGSCRLSLCRTTRLFHGSFSLSFRAASLFLGLFSINKASLLLARRNRFFLVVADKVLQAEGRLLGSRLDLFDRGSVLLSSLLTQVSQLLN